MDRSTPFSLRTNSTLVVVYFPPPTRKLAQGCAILKGTETSVPLGSSPPISKVHNPKSQPRDPRQIMHRRVLIVIGVRPPLRSEKRWGHPGPLGPPASCRRQPPKP